MKYLITLLIILIPSLSHSISPDADFSARCAASGVLICVGLDNTTTDIVQGSTISPDGNGTYRINLDTTIKTSGAGSMRFTFPPPTHAGANINGEYHKSFTPEIGENQHVYVQFRHRITEGLVYNHYGSTWKFFELVHDGSVCGNLGLVFATKFATISGLDAIPVGSVECGLRGLYNNNGIPPYNYQQGDVTCPYPGSGQPTPSTCLFFKPNEWVTWYFHVYLGNFGASNSTIEAWFAREGQTTWTKWIDLPNFVINYGSTPADTFNEVVFTGYMSFLATTSGEPGKTHYAWYDELIVSTSPIAIPGASLTNLDLPLTVGWHQLNSNTTRIWQGSPNVCAYENGFGSQPGDPYDVGGNEDCGGIYSWSSGAFDPVNTRLLVTGGGHAAYYGNEVYAFDFAGSPTAMRLSNPPPPAPTGCASGVTDCAYIAFYSDGCMVATQAGTQPNARHTYDGLVFYKATNDLIAINGSLACTIGTGGITVSAGDMWAFNTVTNTWRRLSRDGTGDNPFSVLDNQFDFSGTLTAYDSVNDTMFYHTLKELYSVKLTGSVLKFRRISPSSSSATFGIHSSAEIDPIERRFYILGDSSFKYYDISGVAADGSPPGSPVSPTTLNTTFLPGNMDNGGLSYFGQMGKLFAWSGGLLYQWDTTASQWHRYILGVNTVSPPSTIDTSIFGRFSCHTDIGGCIIARTTNTPLYYIRLSLYGGDINGPPPPPPPTPFTFPGVGGGVVIQGGTVLQ